MSLECKQLEKVLLLMKVSFVNTFICFVNVLMKVLFKKCLNRTLVMHVSSNQML